MLSFIVLFSRSIISRAFLNFSLTFFRTIKNVPPIIGIIAITVRASFQSIVNKRIVVPKIKNKEDAIEATACETNIFIESISDVKFVSSLEGLASWIKL